MDSPATLTSAFILGLFTTLHCVGMCGGIIGALSLGLPTSIRDNKINLLFFVATYNAGRIISYGLAGLIAGAIGASAMASTGFEQGHHILQYIGLGMMIAVGLYLSGWLPQLARVERIGMPVWKRLEPIGRKFLPVSNPLKAVAYGLIWGWLPCGMVYFVLIWALSTSNAIQGALLMLAFGLGTVPTLLAAGFMASQLMQFARNPKIRSVAGILIIIMAVATLFIPMEHQHNHGTQDGTTNQNSDHSQHMNHTDHSHHH
ncbi:MAG: sulfite exporter TauE/SafE family protein [Gammaproteobacteria bacterium]|nr:sulfite exporter TauE/SafE family protein [Gammaproteobacteria bacterium]